MRAQWSEACEEAREMLGVFLCVCVCVRARACARARVRVHAYMHSHEKRGAKSLVVAEMGAQCASAWPLFPCTRCVSTACSCRRSLTSPKDDPNYAGLNPRPKPRSLSSLSPKS